MQNLLFKNMPDLKDHKNKSHDKKAVSSSKKLKDKSSAAGGGGSSRVTVKGGKGLEARIEAIRAFTKTAYEDDKLPKENIMDEARFRQYMDVVRKNGIWAFDTETGGLDTMDDGIAGICIYTPGEVSAYVPINHVNYITGEKLPGQIPIEVIAEELSNLENVKNIYHNAKFDIRVTLNNVGPRLSYEWDTALGANLLNENEPHNLKYLYEKYVMHNKDLSNLNTYGKLFDGLKFMFIPLDIAYLYAAKDPYMTYKVWEFQSEFLNEESEQCKAMHLEGVAWVFHNIEMPLIDVLIDCEQRGVCIDEPYAEFLANKYHAALEGDKTTGSKGVETEALEEVAKYQHLIDKLPAEKKTKLGNPVNLGSPTQVAILAYDVLGLKSPDKEKPRGTGNEILESYHMPLFDKILEIRGLKKMLSTYIEKLPKEVKPKTNRIHATVNQYGAITGRQSMTNPSLQTIPSHNKDIRPMFIPGEGMVLIGGDYSQQEPRCLAHLSQDPFLIKAYQDGKDIYATIASKVYNLPYADCMEEYLDENGKKNGVKNVEGKKRRDGIKSVVLGIMYGRGAGTIGEQLGISRKEAQQIVDDFFLAFPIVKKYIDQQVEKGRTEGFVETVYGRKRRLPDLSLPEYDIKDKDKKPITGRIQQQYLKLLKHARSSEVGNIIADARKKGIFIRNNGGIIADAERQTLNSIIQGSAADITKIASILIGKDKQLKEWGYGLLFSVHDELIGEAPLVNALKCKKRVTELMLKAAYKVSVPMKVDMEITKKWYGEDISDELTA